MKSIYNGKLKIKKSKIGGRGSFALHDIKKGERIKILSGEKISLKEVFRRIKNKSEQIDDPLQIEQNYFLDLNKPSKLINHSCNPNSGIHNKNELFALRNILKCEEITFDYSTTVSKNTTPDIWIMKCNCGSRKCRKIIGNWHSISKNELNRYLNLGAFPDYIKEEIKQNKLLEKKA